MVLRDLRLTAFRAHAQTRLQFASKVNLLHGPNGAGKTNILEAIHYLGLTKSFLTSQDAYAVREGHPFFEIEGAFEGVRRREMKVRLAYQPEEGKRLFVNGAPVDRMSEFIGQVPLVAFSPDDYVLTAGGPEERRRFLNNILSQARPVYLDDTLQYRRALRQRNELLAHARRTRSAPQAQMKEAWDEELIELGSRIVAGRLRFIEVFAGFLERAYAHIAAVAEHPTLRYVTFAPLEGPEDEPSIAESFRQQLRRVAQRERERGQTLVGPHRDELVFYLDGKEVRRYASQGQHRTFGMALKLAQYFYLYEHLGEAPLFLLDDVVDHLDEPRTRAFLELLLSDAIGQTLLTATRPEPFQQAIDFSSAVHRSLRVENGNIAEAGRM